VRCFVIASAIIYALILVGHVARVASEGIHTLTEPLFLTSSVLAVAMTGWAIYLLVRRRS